MIETHQTQIEKFITRRKLCTQSNKIISYGNFSEKISYEKFKCSLWLLRMLQSGIFLPYSMFSQILVYLLKDLRPLLRNIDEIDTFLYSQETAIHSWEVSAVNELLTSLEECRCFCICTTNRFKELDAAAVRRFSYKYEQKIMIDFFFRECKININTYRKKVYLLGVFHDGRRIAQKSKV